VIEVKIPALTRDMLENDQEYALIVQDVTDELKKFGSLRQFFVNGTELPNEVFLPRPRDLSLF
jgi:hypothetical protein